MKRLLSQKVFLLGMLSFLGLLAGGLIYAAPAKAAGSCSGAAIQSGRAPFCGYFNNNYQDQGDFVLSQGLYNSTNVNAFIAQIESYLSGAYGEQDRTGAEFIIDTMLGLGGGASRNVGSTNCNASSTNAFCVWQVRVRNYASGATGSVNWKQAITVSGNQCNGSASANVNTFYQPSEDDDAYFRDNDCKVRGVNSLTTNFIVFYNKDGSVAYILRIQCGNPYGNLTGLQADTPPQGVITAASCTTVSVKLWDPDTPNNAIQYYLAVNGGAEQGPYTFGGQGAPATRRPVSGYPGFDYWSRNGVTLYGVDSQTGAQYPLGSVTLPICGSITCTGSMTTLPGTMVAGENTKFTVWVVVNNAPSGPPGAKFTSVKMRAPSGANTTIVPPPAGGVGYSGTRQLTDNANPSLSYTPPAAGNYVLSWTFGGGESNPATVTCAPPAGTPSSRASYEPYFTVLGGDISAGQGFGSACTNDDKTANIEGYNLDNGSASPNYFGASARQAAIATGGITEFATDNTNNTATNVGGSTDGLTALTDNSPPKGLAFGNTNSSGMLYGGGILQGNTSMQWCVPDYAGNAPASSTPFNPSQIKSGTYVLNSTVLSSPGSPLVIPAGVQLTLVARGNVYIDGNILYGAYSGNLTDIPQLNLLVSGGNIYVDSKVNELHGFYDAQPNGVNTGNIYTCATGLGASSLDYATCNNPLTVYGAVTAGQIIPGRTAGNVAKSSSVSDYPAEQFVFTPEYWLSGVSGTSTSCANDPTQAGCLYQSYTSLPPVF